MRYVQKIQDLWETGSSSFVGENRPSGRATVEKGFWLEQYMSNAGRKTRGPYRWFQRADDEELVQTEIPNIISIDINREVDSDAATCRLQIQNTISLLYGEVEEAEGVWGKPGWFSFSRGQSQESKARWGQAANEWADVLVPNALIRCVDPQTEIFTKRGWLTCDEIKLGDEALGINPESGMSEWQEIVDIFKERHVGPMVEMKTRGHDSLSTPDHKWLVKQGRGDNKKFEWKCTNTLNTNSFIPLAVMSSDIPTSETYSDDFVELAAWYFTEGTAEHRQRSMTWGGSICQSRTANPQNVERIEALMTRLYGPPGPLPQGPFVSQDRIDKVLSLRSEGLSYRKIASILGENKESVRRWITGERPTVKSNRWRIQESEGWAVNFKFTAEVANDIRKVVQGPDKIPSMEFLMSLTQKQLDLFIDVCILADGHTPDDESRNRVFIQQAGGRLDAFVTACALAGKAVSVTEKQLTDGQTVNCCKVTLLNMDECAPVNALAQSKSEPNVIDYDGIIWCPSVKHGNWLARRNGRLYYTGNTYQGYGGHDKTIDEALTDEDIVQTGCWLVDRVDIQANGNLTVTCRDMNKLLVDQQLYPPLMPKKLYPLDYYRWVLTNQTIAKDQLPSNGIDPIGLPCTYGCEIGGSASSSTDAIYGFNTPILGHYPTDAFDSSSEPLGMTEPGSYAHQSTFWLSNGHSSANGSGSFEWIEVCCDGQDVNKMYIHPFGGDYECYISVWENGGWVAPEDSLQGGMIPYGGVDYVGANTAEIPYVTKVGVKWEAIDRQAEHLLPRVYKADKIRLTFTNLTRTDWEAPNNYRAGVRKTFPMFDRKAALGGEHLRCFTCAPFPKVDSDALGYWQVRQNGNVYAFGDARVYTPHTSNPRTAHKYWVVSAYGNHDGLGYWTMGMDGTVIGYGSAQHYGDASSTGETGFMGFAPTPSGNGYWLLHRDGYVYAYGDAVHEGDSSYTATLPTGVPAVAHAIESHPDNSGYWVLWTDGHVDAIGSVTHYGDADRFLFTDTEYVACLRRTSTGNGYWIVSGSGWVKAFGDAPYRDSAERYEHKNWADSLIWDFVPNWNSDNGYALQRANGALEIFGDFEIFGSVAEGVATLRSDGNYRDYSDIVKELALWAGYLMYDTETTPQEPEVFGIIEKTGAYSKESLPQEMFDKRPVIDPITELKQVVGYIVWCDQEGGFRFQSPNWWSLGNYDYDNEEIDLIPVVDERVNLISYGVSTADGDLRSEIMISTEDPTVGFSDTLTTRIKPHGANMLRGMVKPGHWINGNFVNKKQQEVMADLISMHIWFGQRRGSAKCWANPLIDINDQVRIYERTTGETFVHYVRGVSTTFNALTGEYTMELTTNWLGGSPFNNRPMFFACAAMPDGSGYWQARNDGQIWSFGEAELYSTDDTHRDWVVAMKSTQTGLGYYTLDITGKVIAYGDAVHYGDLVSNEKDVLDMALTPTGEGYWLLKSTGEVLEFGDATDHGDDTPTGELPSGVDVICHAIESHPSLDGFWILRTDGTVVDFGAVTHYGNADRTGFTGTEYVATLRRTETGSGYWIVSGGGKVQEFGDAVNHGEPSPYSQNFWVDGLVWDFMPDYSGTGYIIQHSDGILDFYSSTFNGDARKHDYSVDADWAVTGGRGNSGGSTVGLTSPDDHFEISPDVIEFLGNTGSPSANKAADAGFKVTVEPTGP